MFAETLFTASGIKAVSTGFLCKYITCLVVAATAQFWAPYLVDIPEESVSEAQNSQPPMARVYDVSHILIHNNHSHLEFRKQEDMEIVGKGTQQRKNTTQENTECVNHPATQPQNGACNSHYNVILNRNIRSKIINRIIRKMECSASDCWATEEILDDGSHCILDSGDPLPSRMKAGEAYHLGEYTCHSPGSPAPSEGTLLPRLNTPSLNSWENGATRSEPYQFPAERYATVLIDDNDSEANLVIIFEKCFQWGCNSEWSRLDKLLSYWSREQYTQIYELGGKSSQFKSVYFNHEKRSIAYTESTSLMMKYKVSKSEPINVSSL